MIFRLKNLRYNKNAIEFTVFDNMNLILNRIISQIYLSAFSILILGNCSVVESEKAYCEKKAERYFLLCLVDIKTAPSYFGKAEWNSQQIQAYSQSFCVAEYIRKKRCPDQKAPEVKEIVFVCGMPFTAGNDEPLRSDGAEDEPVDDQPVPQVEGKSDPKCVRP